MENRILGDFWKRAGFVLAAAPSLGCSQPAGGERPCAKQFCEGGATVKKFIVLLLVFGLMAASCDAGAGDGEDNLFTGTFISGSFNKAGGGEVKFGLKQDEKAAPAGSVQTLRSVSEDAENTLTGVLEDDDLIIRLGLEGSYDPVTGTWSVSARPPSYDRLYAIAGTFYGIQRTLRVIATVMAKSEGQWVADIAPVTEEAVSIAGTAAEGADGLPSALHGCWYSRGGAESLSALVSDWKILLSGTETNPEGIPIAVSRDCNVLEVSGNGPYEITYCYPKYQMTTENLRDALADFLGLKQSDITAIDRSNPVDLTESDRRVFVIAGENGVELIYLYPEGFSAEELRLVEAFHAIGGYAAWAAKNSISQETKYEKIKVTLDGGQFILTSLAGGTSPSFTYNYGTLAELEAATLTEVDDIQGQYMERTLHR